MTDRTKPIVSVSIVTWNSLRFLPYCLEHLRGQEGVKTELIVVDNASTDGTLEYLKQQTDIRLIEMSFNSGFSAAHNRGISAASGQYVLILNPDVFMSPHFLFRMVEAINLDPCVGQVSGKLYRIATLAQIGKSKIWDSTGLYFTPNQRHFDRGAGEVDVGQYEQIEYIFGVSGAAALYRRQALENTAIRGEYFDEDFFAYREDADLSWRMQIMGWKALYTPYAIAYHVRKVQHADRRQDIPSEINMHSVKNRFLMRIKNQTWRNALRFLLPTLWRDLQVVGYVTLIEHASLPAFERVVRLLPLMLKKRQQVMRKKRVSDCYIAQWFSYRRVSFPYTGTEQAE